MKKLILLFTLLTGLANAQLTQTNLVTGLPYPVCLAQAPDGRFFVSCKGGSGFSSPSNAFIKVYSSTGTFQANLWDFTDSVETYFERGVLGVAIDPDFMTNHYVYVFYNHEVPAMIRVVRFTETAGVGTNPTVIFEVADGNSAGNHTGGNIHFRPSEPDKLYITIGDRADNNDRAQMLNRWEGKILRINKDGTIPTDNPFYDDGNPFTGNQDWIWSYGHRNAFDFCFSTTNDSLYISENGQNSQDEMNLGTKGGNYGWPACEGTLPYEGSCTGFIAPLETWGTPLPAVTGIVFYTHTLMPAYTNHLIVTDYDDANVWNITLGNAPAYDQFVSRTAISGITSVSGLTDIEQGLEGCLYLIDGGYTPTGRLIRICPTGMEVDEFGNTGSFMLYPNPANEFFTVEGNEVSSLELFDLNGKLLATSSGKQMDISQLTPGVYHVRINGTKTTKLVKL